MIVLIVCFLNLLLTESSFSSMHIGSHCPIAYISLVAYGTISTPRAITPKTCWDLTPTSFSNRSVTHSPPCLTHFALGTWVSCLYRNTQSFLPILSPPYPAFEFTVSSIWHLNNSDHSYIHCPVPVFYFFLYTSTYLILTTTLWGKYCNYAVLYMRKLRHREVLELSQGHRVIK